MDPLKDHTIQFSGLKDGAHEFQFELGDDFFAAAGEEEFEGGRVNVLVNLHKSATMLVTNIHVEGPVSVRCDHCNAPMDLVVKGDQRQIFQLHGDPSEDDDELVTLEPAAHSINLTHYIYECLRLSLPARKVHPAGQCDPEVEKALGDLAVEHEPVPDPRWDALKQLKTKRP
ncbi:MAG: DUF177 domain-containing protein [Flavobacteriales bacterium]|nr:DUF177 domain-containing protein [Flavobacteriales bacterium]